MRNRLIVNAVVLAVALAWGTCGGSSAYTYRVIHNFCSRRLCADGQTPMSGLVMDATGILYGATRNGGVAFNGPGAVYELVPNADGTRWRSHTLYAFPDKANASAHPLGTPILDTDGNLYGTTFDGGAGDQGALYELTRNGTKVKRIYRQLVGLGGDVAKPTAGFSYQGQASGAPYDGISPLYGTSTAGPGAVFQLTRSGDTWTLNTIYNFCQKGQSCPDGEHPNSVLIDASGNVLGTTALGGPHPYLGVVYELASSGGNWTETVLHEFCQEQKCHDGLSPGSALIADVLGNLYGTTSTSYRRNGGAVFKLETDGTYSLLYKFCTIHQCADGATPSDLVMDSSGVLYGLTGSGGANDGDAEHKGGGTVFALNGTTLQTLYSFCAQRDCTDGEYPVGGLIMDASGNLFGVTQAGGKYDAGVVFELTP